MCNIYWETLCISKPFFMIYIYFALIWFDFKKIQSLSLFYPYYKSKKHYFEIIQNDDKLNSRWLFPN